MPDHITVRDTSTLPPHKEGQFAAICADVIDLGQRVETYPGSSPRVVRKVGLVFVTTEHRQDGKPSTVSTEFTVSMNERAGLRRFLESWRGRSYTPDETAGDAPLRRLVGQPALLTLENRCSAKGRNYAKIASIAPLPKGKPAPEVNGYRRSLSWEERKKLYEAEVARHMAGPGATAVGQ